MKRAKASQSQANMLEIFKRFFAIAVRCLPQDQQRRLLGSLANEIGRGGQAIVCALTGRDASFVSRGQREAATRRAEVPETSARGRHGILKKYPSLENDIQSVMSENCKQDPRAGGGRPASAKSLREIKGELTARFGYSSLPGDTALYKTLGSLSYKLKVAKKAKPHAAPPDLEAAPLD